MHMAKKSLNKSKKRKVFHAVILWIGFKILKLILLHSLIIFLLDHVEK